MYACGNNNVEGARMLLKAGADLHAKDKDGNTAWDFAADEYREIDMPMISFLLEKGADVNAKISDRYTTYANLSKSSTALIQASSYGDIGMIRLLLEKGADVNAKDKSGRTALIEASYEFDGKHLEKVVVLLDSGADVNAENIWGESPITRACYAQNKEIVKELVKRSANVNAKNAEGKTALMYCFNGVDDNENASLLLKHGADIDARDEKGCTLLMRCCASRSDSAITDIRFCLKNGSNTDIKDNEGKTVMDKMDTYSRPIRDLLRKENIA